MTRLRLWGYVASGARALAAFGGAGGTGRRSGPARAGGLAVSETEEGLGQVPSGAMAAPRALDRTELERLRWTGRQAGCEPMARHVQVADVVRRVLRGGDRSAAVAVRLAPGLPVVAGDARRLEAALSGLVDHAIRRSPPGGLVLVRAVVAGAVSPRRPSGREAAGDGARRRGREPGRVEIRISDRGSHQPPEARQWLLAGVRADGPVGPALHSLVLAAGGRLAVESTPGGGLTVVLLLTVAYD
ncbi:sensor histidine kinase [Kitasatospora sp. NPDC056446]|uniref:sensor histidine kinase n=1 Tax=Kitasatospora sp. NPDC056446 TaxID=3345819 RepID=UPI0036B5F57F